LEDSTSINFLTVELNSYSGRKLNEALESKNATFEFPEKRELP
jgi:hypothetical protein